MVLLIIVGWVVAGLIAGFVASKVVNLRGDDARLGIGVAVGGAVVAGLLHALIGGSGMSAWNPWGLLFAALGGVVGAVIWHLVRSRYISHAPSTHRTSY